MHIIKRGLLGLSVLAAVGGTTGGLLAAQAGASPTRGPEVIRSTQYQVGASDSVGPFTGHGTVRTAGNVTDIASAMKDPPNSNRHLLVDSTGSFTVLTTGGTQGPFSMNDQTCAVRFSIKGIDANIVKGTGAYRHATGDFKANVVVSGYTQRLKDGSCDQSNNDPPAFSTTSVVAVGFINLH